MKRALTKGRTLLALAMIAAIGADPADTRAASGVEPGAIDGRSLGSHPSCEARGHGMDPLACFAAVFGEGF